MEFQMGKYKRCWTFQQCCVGIPNINQPRGVYSQKNRESWECDEAEQLIDSSVFLLQVVSIKA